jgi:hypothetical protein
MLDAARVIGILNRLRSADTRTFGAESHRFLLNPPLTESAVRDFERQHKVELPPDYRHFLTAIGNGGAGPYYGVFPLGQRDGDAGGLQPWHEDNGFVGILSKPFPLTAEWNDLNGKPSDALADSDEDEYWRQMDAFYEAYHCSSLMNGAIPICHEGCALRVWLVLTGAQAGRLWHDGRSDYTGIKPLRLADGSPATFSSWYDEWLSQALEAATARGR